MNYLSMISIKKSISANQLIILASLYFTFIFNIPFLSRVYTAVVSQEVYNLPFLISVPLLLLSLVVIFLTLFSVKYVLKGALISLTIYSSLLFFSTITYGIVFDYGMLQNVFETHPAEAFSYFNLYSLVFFVITGIIPSLIILKINIHYQPLFSELLTRLKVLIPAIVMLLLVAIVFYSNYSSVGRNNRGVEKYLIPFQAIASTVHYVKKNYLSPPMKFSIIDDAPTLETSDPSISNITVLVVGETARAKNYSINGYQKNTNRHTENLSLVSFKDMYSCGTATAVSVPCMFSALTKENYDGRKASHQQNILDIAKLAGMDVLWIDNTDGCKGVCKRIPTIKIDPKSENPLCDGVYCFDLALLAPFKEKIHNLTSKNTLVVLHLIGSHGPTYYRRYPEEHKIFTPDCPRSDIQNCSAEELVNTYDNTIAYTDFILSKVVEELSAHAASASLQEQKINTSMIYISDHGESLGEGGAYLHGFPYSLAPVEQIHIPMLFWSNNIDTSANSCLAQLAENKYSHDNLYHSLLGLMEVHSKSYIKEQDLFSSCK
ncbi:MAG: phosphoethanolamine--lipid A transferase [Colwellia sp.]|nr:phosphoethanolamine--lipid A transferase [Colwellia sp.]